PFWNDFCSFCCLHCRCGSDVGTQRERLDTDALRRFEACWLCNRTALAPVCTPQGLVYCKQCLFFNFEDQKKRMAKELKEWEAQQIAKKEKNPHLLIGEGGKAAAREKSFWVREAQEENSLVKNFSETVTLYDVRAGRIDGKPPIRLHACTS
ncbi:Zn-finger, RING domain containing protein, partial [Toxoplasma gondii p89]